MNIAIFFPPALGDALLCVPLVKELKRKSYTVTGVFSSSPSQQLFLENSLLNGSILLDSKRKQLFYSIIYFRKFDSAFLNVFSSTRANLFLSFFIAKKTKSNFISQNLHTYFSKRIDFVKPRLKVHDAVQNLNIAFQNFENTNLKEEDFLLPVKSSVSSFSLPQAYIAVQISAINNMFQYKNWPVQNWIVFLKAATKEFPHLTFVLLGESKEIQLAEKITNENIRNVLSLVGKTEVCDLIPIIGNSRFFLGLDGGLMHLAVALNKPTFTLWGPSDFELYGYHWLNSEKHKIIYRDMTCRPCNSWIAPNTSRVSKPEECPDYACMTDLKPLVVLEQFSAFCKSRVK